jgi:hypothetical protein
VDVRPGRDFLAVDGPGRLAGEIGHPADILVTLLPKLEDRRSFKPRPGGCGINLIHGWNLAIGTDTLLTRPPAAEADWPALAGGLVVASLVSRLRARMFCLCLCLSFCPDEIVGAVSACPWAGDWLRSRPAGVGLLPGGCGCRGCGSIDAIASVGLVLGAGVAVASVPLCLAPVRLSHHGGRAGVGYPVGAARGVQLVGGAWLWPGRGRLCRGPGRRWVPLTR